MSFKEQVLTLLPPGSVFLRMFSESPKRSKLEYQLNDKWNGVLVDKVDLGKLSEVIPFISIQSPCTYNDLYKHISDMFDLGLVQGTDYENSEQLSIDSSDRFLTLPVLPDSLGYYGEFKCRVRASGDSLNSHLSNRDLTTISFDEFFPLAAIRLFLITNVFSLPEGKLFSDVGLSSLFINDLVTKLNKHFPKYTTEYLHELLQRGQVTGLVNDGITDLFVFKLPDGNELFVRFSSQLNDLPNVNFIFNSGINTLDDNSEGLLSGSESVDLENPVENEGETLYKQALTLVNDPNPSLTPKENITQQEEKDQQEDIIKDIGQELEIVQEEMLIEFE